MAKVIVTCERCGIKDEINLRWDGNYLNHYEGGYFGYEVQFFEAPEGCHQHVLLCSDCRKLAAAILEKAQQSLSKNFDAFITEK